MVMAPVQGIPAFGASASGAVSSLSGNTYGPTLYVNTANAGSGNGKSPKNAFLTMEEAFDALATMQSIKDGSASNATIYAMGDIREQITAPLGVYGGRIIGAVNGNPRNATENGVEQPALGAVWRNPASSTASVPLLTLREQGWTIQNMLFNPSDGYTAVRLRTQEDADYPSAGHAVFVSCRFIGAAALGTPAGTGIGDYGGAGFVSVEGCQFQNLEYAINGQNFAVATPLMWRVGTVQPNIFQLNKNDIVTNASGWVLGANQFLTPYDGSTHPNTLNLATSATGTYRNLIAGALFADAAADVAVAKGYKPGNASDAWRFYAANTAAYTVTTPS